MTDGDSSMRRSHRVFSTFTEARDIEVEVGFFVASPLSNSRGVYNAHQPGFLLHLLEDQLQKAGVSGD